MIATCPSFSARRLLVFAVWLACAVVALPAAADPCTDMIKLRIQHTAMTGAETVPAGTFAAPTGPPQTGLPSFCRVSATLKPAPDSDIRVEVWMPITGWNDRLEGVGDGGFAGRISYNPLAAGVKLGYAVVSTDMGLAIPAGADQSIFVNRPERSIDWGYRATHEMTVVAKLVVSAYYGRAAKRSYFTGCSTGGEQAVMEAQRFPDDYDGIVGGAPANNRTGAHMSILWNFVTTHDPSTSLPPAKIALLAHAVVDRCDMIDGVKDGLITDPRACRFNPAALLCSGKDEEGCLTRSQVDTANKLYSGPVNSRTGQSIYPGVPRGSEINWDKLSLPAGSPPKAPPYEPIFQWAFGTAWDWRHFSFDNDVQPFERALSGNLNATSADLDSFRSQGHKMLLYHGWSDSLLAPGATIQYYESILKRDRSANGSTAAASGSSHSPLSNSVRLFMIPGMGHCIGGPGPSHFNALGEVVKWVEEGVAPDQIIVTEAPTERGETPGLKRILCPFPAVAHYVGSGDTNLPSSYVCQVPRHHQ